VPRQCLWHTLLTCFRCCCCHCCCCCCCCCCCYPAGCSCAGATYQPVCGRNGKTYATACEADCDNTEVVSLGACTSASIGATPTSASSHAQGCVCPQVYRPVCTHVGVTQYNECTAACLGQRVVTKGVCPQKAAGAGAGAGAGAAQKPRPPRQEGCVCAANYAPVCGTVRWGLIEMMQCG
jgi:hypothetical protein